MNYIFIITFQKFSVGLTTICTVTTFEKKNQKKIVVDTAVLRLYKKKKKNKTRWGVFFCQIGEAP